MSADQNIKTALTWAPVQKRCLARDGRGRLGGELLKMKQKPLVFINAVKTWRETKLLARD